MTMVDRFTSINDAFDDTTVGLSLDQVAARAELPRSTTHRILDHLVRLNWLSHSERGYGLGKRAVSGTIDGRPAVGIVLPDRVSPDRYRPMVIAAAMRIRAALGGQT